jgi:hypothetical protein
VRALKSINDLPAGKAVTVIGTEADRKTLVDAGVRVEDVGDTRGAEGKKKEVARLRLYVFTATREKAAPAVGRPLNE